jgi:LPXTG-motif cell wall-anchored protein
MPPSNGSDGGIGQEAVAGGALIIIAGGTVAAATGTDQTGPILAFVGALLVAVIAALTAGRRQRRALDAESARLAQQLKHDRELSDVAHLRELLDNAAYAYESAFRALRDLGLAVDRKEFGEVKATYASADTALEEFRATTSRLRLRFVLDHPIVTGYDRSLRAFVNLQGALLEGPLTSPAEPWDLDEVKPHFDEAWAGFHEFSTASRDLIGPPTGIEEHTPPET